MSVLHQNVSIANGESESTELDLTDRVLMAIELGAWTAADVTLLAAQKSTADGGTYVPVKAIDGTDVKFVIATNTICVLTDANLTRGLRFIKLKSSVNQGADRTINVATIEDDRV